MTILYIIAFILTLFVWFLADNSNIFGLFFVPRRWQPFPKKKPPSEKWYLCTVEYNSVQFPMFLYWKGGCFINPNRQSVFAKYAVIEKTDVEHINKEAIMPDFEQLERIETDSQCDLTEYVTAWKREPKLYKSSKKINLSYNDQRFSCLETKKNKEGDNL